MKFLNKKLTTLALVISLIMNILYLNPTLAKSTVLGPEYKTTQNKTPEKKELKTKEKGKGKGKELLLTIAKAATLVAVITAISIGGIIYVVTEELK